MARGHDAETKRYHRADSHLAKKIRPENLIVFDSAEEAEAKGFRPSRFAREKDEEMRPLLITGGRIIDPSQGIGTRRAAC